MVSLAFGSSSSGRRSPRLIFAAAIVIFSLFSYFRNSSVNPITGEKQHVAMSVEEENVLGLQARGEMTQQFGGLSSDGKARERVQAMGDQIIARSVANKSPYRFQFHLLADPETINAFALPGGQVFITEALYRQLKTNGQLAGVLGHEIGHVLERHSAQQLAKARLSQGIAGAGVIATYDPNNRASQNTAQLVSLVASLVTLRYGREDELEADRWGVRLSAQAGYDPRAMLAVMKILEKSSKGRNVEFFSTHPNPEHRLDKIESVIAKEFPSGVPAGLEN